MLNVPMKHCDDDERLLLFVASDKTADFRPAHSAAVVVLPDESASWHGAQARE
jgi:hypothetical protein